MENASRPGSTVLDKGGGARPSDCKDRVGNFLSEIDDLKERIEYLKREIQREKKKLHAFIDGVNDERIRMALRLKYLHDLTWVQTAEILGDSYTDESIKKLCYKYISTK